jgi:hypothetical protein
MIFVLESSLCSLRTSIYEFAVFNSLVKLFFMQLNQNNADRSKDIVNQNEKVIQRENIENFNYLYPNGHRITHQMRWFKGSRNRGLRSDTAA